MTDEINVEEAPIIIARKSGQDIGNPIPPSIIAISHEGHKADSNSWTRTKKKTYLKKRAKQLINNGSDDRALYAIIAPRRQNS